MGLKNGRSREGPANALEPKIASQQNSQGTGGFLIRLGRAISESRSRRNPQPNRNKLMHRLPARQPLF